MIGSKLSSLVISYFVGTLSIVIQILRLSNFEVQFTIAMPSTVDPLLEQ